jgi:hypothetical protein
MTPAFLRNGLIDTKRCRFREIPDFFAQRKKILDILFDYIDSDRNRHCEPPATVADTVADDEGDNDPFTDAFR